MEVTVAVPKQFSSGWLESDNFFDFAFVTVPEITSFDPKGCGEDGGVWVSIKGVNFRKVDTLYCRFGDGEPVPGKFISPRLVKCQANAHSEMKVPLAITNDGKKWSNEMMFEYSVRFLEMVDVPDNKLYGRKVPGQHPENKYQPTPVVPKAMVYGSEM